VAAAQLPAQDNFRSHPTQVQYRECLNVGYRFHDTFGVAPRFCFGHGLSYTTFEYADLAVSGVGTQWEVAFTLTNTGSRAGAEVVQLYVHDVAASVARPEQELKAFTKVWLEPGQSTRVVLSLGRRAFAVYDVPAAMLERMIGQMPLRALVTFSEGKLSLNALEALIRVLNLGLRKAGRSAR